MPTPAPSVANVRSASTESNSQCNVPCVEVQAFKQPLDGLLHSRKPVREQLIAEPWVTALGSTSTRVHDIVHNVMYHDALSVAVVEARGEL